MRECISSLGVLLTMLETLMGRQHPMFIVTHNTLKECRKVSAQAMPQWARTFEKGLKVTLSIIIHRGVSIWCTVEYPYSPQLYIPSVLGAQCTRSHQNVPGRELYQVHWYFFSCQHFKQLLSISSATNISCITSSLQWKLHSKRGGQLTAEVWLLFALLIERQPRCSIYE